MFKYSQSLLRCSKNCGKLPYLGRLVNFSSSSPVAEAKNVQNASLESNIEETLPKSNSNRYKSSGKDHSTMIAAAFASLNSDGSTNIQTPFTDKKIESAETVDQLLSLSEGNGISRRHALKVVSVLADWTTSGKVKLAEFESDSRFVRLCKILTKGSNVAPVSSKNRLSVASRSEDLSTILSVTADDEAAKLVASITLPQMVKVMSTLSQKKRRSTLLLRALSYNITACSDELDLKQSADLLFSMSSLNFPDENLLARISTDVCRELKKDIKKSSVIGSIITSLGLLKYKESTILDALSEWIANNSAISRPQDIFSLFMTLAVLNYMPANSEKLFTATMTQLNPSEAGKPLVWLEIVWSLVLLNRATPEQISSVLSENFITQIENIKSVNTSMKLKLLNIDAAANYMTTNYEGPRLPPDSNIRKINITKSKDKTEMVDALIDSLKNLIQSTHHLRTNVNTGLGFCIDAECLLDKKCTPLPLSEPKPDIEAFKIALLAHDYHDMTRGRVEPTGINSFITKLLEAQGYKVIAVPHTDFKPRDKLVHRVQYLETKLKEVVKC